MARALFVCAPWLFLVACADILGADFNRPGATSRDGVATGDASSEETEESTGPGSKDGGAGRDGSPCDGCAADAAILEVEPGPVLSAGQNHTCASNAGGVLNCWGANGFGQLGAGATSGDKLATKATAVGPNVTAVSAGSAFTCAIESGNAKCWGANDFGQLGDGSKSTRLAPVVPQGLGSGVRRIAVAYEHACVIDAAGALRCWGRNNAGELGDGTTSDRTIPTAVPGFDANVSSTCAAVDHSCAVKAGEVFCWGDNSHGMLGDGTVTQRTSPTRVTGLSNVRAVSCSAFFTCALSQSGAVECWGENELGTLGGPSTETCEDYRCSTRPVKVTGLGSGVVAISAGWAHGCAVLDDGSVRCWGFNGWGQVGDGTNTHRFQPVTLAGVSGAIGISASSGHTCAALSNGKISCWGSNEYLQLGVSSTNATCQLNSDPPFACSRIPVWVQGL